MWGTHSDHPNRLTLQGCCLIPDNNLSHATRSLDDLAISALDTDNSNLGDDRLEITVAKTLGPSELYYTAIQAAPSPEYIDAIVDSPALLSINTDADFEVLTAATLSEDTGYILEWSLLLPENIQKGSAFACQFSRYDIDATMNTSTQEHAFGQDPLTPPLEQMGTCILN